MNEQIKINWYRCKVDKKVMSELMKTSDWQGFKQCVGQLGLFLCTGTMAFLAYKNIHADNWTWAVPFMLFALFLHGTFSCFMGMAAPVHELCHKTPFKTKWINEFFIRIYSFISWTDYIGFRASHVKHHQVTTHTEYDEEVVLPQTLNETVVMVLKAFTFDPVGVYKHIRAVVLTAFGKKTDWIFKSSWMDKVIPDSNVELRKERAADGAGHRPRPSRAGRHFHRDRQLVPRRCLQSRRLLLRLAHDALRHAPALRPDAQRAGPSPLLPHLYVQLAAEVPVLEHAVPHRTPHVPGGALL